jgi:hypothetical protein
MVSMSGMAGLVLTSKQVGAILALVNLEKGNDIK